MSILGNKKLVRLSVALFGGKKPDRTGPENTSRSSSSNTYSVGREDKSRENTLCVDTSPLMQASGTPPLLSCS